MLPLTLAAAQKLSNLLTTGNALQRQISAVSGAANATVPLITPAQVVLSSTVPDMGDEDLQLTYPRICLYTAAVKNTQIEKFRSLSGTVSVVAEVWASGDLLSDTDQWIHYYVEAMTNILRQNIGDWGDGVFFSGIYEVQLQSPKVGGVGYVESAKVSVVLNVSRT
jgi:molybdopterin-binding protein